MEIVPSQGAPPAQDQGRCAYCGAPLHPALYFCAVCATPYRHYELTLPQARPPRATSEELVELLAPQVKGLFFWFLGVLVAAAITSYLLWGERHLELSLSFQSACLLVLTCVYGVMRRRSLAAQFRQVGFTHWAAWAGVAALAVMLPINYGWTEFLRYIAPPSMRHDSGFGDLDLGARIVLICVLPAIVEETAFRGLVQHWLHVALKPWKAIAAASFLFTVLHFSVLSFPYIFALGFLLGWVKWKTGSLYPPMLMHFLHNFIVVQYMM
jgi:membrane protease YdiL (CAAX protease family)